MRKGFLQSFWLSGTYAGFQLTEHQYLPKLSEFMGSRIARAAQDAEGELFHSLGFNGRDTEGNRQPMGRAKNSEIERRQL